MRQKLANFIQLTVLAICLTTVPIAVVTGAATLLSGCTSTQKTVVFNTLSAVATTVDSALKAYSDLVVAGKVDQPTQIKVADAKLKYEIAFAAAVTAARGNLQAPTPSDVQALADSLTTIIKTITG